MAVLRECRERLLKEITGKRFWPFGVSGPKWPKCVPGNSWLVHACHFRATSESRRVFLLSLEAWQWRLQKLPLTRAVEIGLFNRPIDR